MLIADLASIFWPNKVPPGLISPFIITPDRLDRRCGFQRRRPTDRPTPTTQVAFQPRSSRCPQLLKLGVEPLPVGADAGIAGTAVLCHSSACVGEQKFC